MMWRLVHSSWILHVSCNKRRVAHIAALLSSVLHSSTFSESSMHLSNGGPGPLKWVCTHFGHTRFLTVGFSAYCLLIHIFAVHRKNS